SLSPTSGPVKLRTFPMAGTRRPLPMRQHRQGPDRQPCTRRNRAMSTNTASVPYGEVLRSIINTSEAAAAAESRPRPFAFGRNTVQAATSVHAPAVLRRHPHLVRFADVEADLDLLIDRAIAAIMDGEPTEDEILGHYVNIASLVRAVSFREGKL